VFLDERFWSKVNKTDTCWQWTAATVKGYGIYALLGKNFLAHRLAYADAHDGLASVLPVLDHTCHNIDSTCEGGVACPHRACVNPAHLIPSTKGDNLRASPLTLASKQIAKTHCPKGHEYDEANTYVWGGMRHCRECGRERAREYQRKKREV
jgi:hypothetical protein